MGAARVQHHDRVRVQVLGAVPGERLRSTSRVFFSRVGCTRTLTPKPPPPLQKNPTKTPHQQPQPQTKQSAFGLLSNVSCLGTETDRPFCYVKKNSCPEGVKPMISDYYGSKASSAYAQWDYCQPYTQAVKSPPAQRTRNEIGRAHV